MRFFLRNSHIYVFALFFIGLAVAVGDNPQIARDIAQRIVQDSVVIADATDTVINDMRDMKLKDASEEAIDLFVKAVRLPSLLLENVQDALEDARRRMASQHPDLFLRPALDPHAPDVASQDAAREHRV